MWWWITYTDFGLKPGIMWTNFLVKLVLKIIFEDVSPMNSF